MSKNLVMLVNEANTLEQMLIESGGEITSEIENALIVKENLIPEKIDNYSLIMDRFEHLESYYKERANMFLQIAEQCENVQYRLKENIKSAMIEMKADEIKGFDIRFKLQKTKPKLVVDNEEKIPKDYYKVVTTESLDKEKLKEDLAIGKVEGAHLEQSYALKTYANTPKKKDKKDE